jgi:hypothetical protein
MFIILFGGENPFEKPEKWEPFHQKMLSRSCTSKATDLEILRHKFVHVCLFFVECRGDDLIKVVGNDWRLILDEDKSLSLDEPAFIFYPDGSKNNPNNDLKYGKIIPCCCSHSRDSTDESFPFTVCQTYIKKIPDSSRSTLRIIRHRKLGKGGKEVYTHSMVGKNSLNPYPFWIKTWNHNYR